MTVFLRDQNQSSLCDQDGVSRQNGFLNHENLPCWVDALFDDHPELSSSVIQDGDLSIRVLKRHANGMMLISAFVPGAKSLDTENTRRCTRRVYELLLGAGGGAMYPSRVWNFLPGITEIMPDALERYMAFNLGRHDAMTRWLKDSSCSRQNLPTATGVGHFGTDLAVHMLATPVAPEAVENPRQQSAFRYSRKFGPLPPFFVRASVADIAGEQRLLIAGTASIYGEESVHVGNLDKQLDETFENLTALITASADSSGDALSKILSVRAYFPQMVHAERIEYDIKHRLPGCQIEMVCADLCRKELLVEIEGVASAAGRYPRSEG